MFSRILEVTTIATIFVILVMPFKAAFAAPDFDAQAKEIKSLCEEEAGRFEVSWIYNDGSAQWGEQWHCDAEQVKIKCLDGVCRIYQIAQPVTTS